MRLWVRPDVRMILSIGISRAIGSIPDASENETLDQTRFTLSPDDLFPGVPSVDKKR